MPVVDTAFGPNSEKTSSVTAQTSSTRTTVLAAA
jgi:hypothetical protein